MNALWDLLRCPACHDPLAFERWDANEGLLRSGCGLWFPVIGGIPRIFVGEMRTIYEREFGDFLRRHGLTHTAVPEADADTRAKLATRESFGFEWSHFHEMLPQWEENARFYFEPLGGAERLRGRLVLDAGCGKGRHGYHALRGGARLVAVDFSRAIEVAERNCSTLDGERLFVQADLTSMPFAPGTFDVAYSLGVLHHLPNPEAGFRKLTEVVRPGGDVLIYVYHALEEAPVKRAVLAGVTLVRRITTRMPHAMLLPLTTLLGWGLYAGVVWPYRVARRVPLARRFAERLPLRSYAPYPVRVIINDQFDRFSAPIENRYRRAEVLGWLERAGLGRANVLGGAGWRAAASKPV